MRVVLVDPSRTVLKFVSRLLEARDHEVRPFTDGQAALDYIKSDLSVGALISSSELLTMSGIELCWEARALTTHNRQIYLLLMSSNQDRHKLIEALDSGADDYIGKPPAPEELYARLRAAERLAAMQHELMRLATTDPLTGVANRRAFFERADAACARVSVGEPVSAIMFDIDHFKRINDTHGHDVGDKALVAVAQTGAACGGIIGRLGGEEFAVLLEGVGLEGAIAVAEKLRRDVAALSFPGEQLVMTLTCSFGVSTWQAGDSIDLLLKRADVALYAAKTAGRNCVLSVDPGMTVNGASPARSLVRGSVRA